MKKFTIFVLFAMVFCIGVSICGCASEPPKEDVFLDLYIDGELYKTINVKDGLDEAELQVSKDGWDFTGWYDESNQRYIYSSVVLDDMKLYGYYYSKNLKFTKSNDVYSVSAGTNTDATIVLPPVYENFAVSQIADGGFYKCETLHKIVLPKTIDVIGIGAFQFCTALEEVEIGEGSVLSEIKTGAFFGCGSLKNITIPEKVDSIGESVFEYCTGLEQISVESGNSKFASVDGVLLNSAKTTLVTYPAGKTQKKYVIPDSVMEIAPSAFYACDYLEEITIPDTVATIGNNAFAKSKALKKVSFSADSQVSLIPESAFADCGELVEVVLGANIEELGNTAFYGCGKLVSIRFLGNSKPVWLNESALKNCTALESVFVSDEAAKEMLSGVHWKNYTNIIKIYVQA